MARKTKVQVIEELQVKGIDFDENGKYNDLYALLMGTSTVKTTPTVKTTSSIWDNLIARAKEIGFTDEQIATYSDPAALKIACDQVRLQATAHESPLKKKPVPYRRPVGVPSQATCTIEITDARANYVRRCTYDEGQLGDFCRRERIDPRSIVKLTIIRDCVLNSRGCFITEILIDYIKSVW